jgi:hypothetical protein
MERYIDWVLRRRVLVLIICLAISVLAVLSTTRAVLSSSMGKLLLGDSPAYAEYLERINRYGTDQIMVFAVEDVDLFDVARLDALKRVEDRIREIPEVLDIHSLLDAQQVWVDNEAEDAPLSARVYVDWFRNHPDQKDLIVSTYMEDTRYQGLLISKNGRHHSIIVEFIADIPTEKNAGIVESVLDAFGEEGFQRDRVRRSGMLAVLAEMIKETNRILKRIFPVTCIILLIVVFLLFQRLWPVFLSGAVAMIGVLWTMGFSILLDPEVSIMISMVPAVTVIVAFSDVIHLSSAYLLELSRDKNKEEAIRAAGVDVGRACLYTSMTTLLGFLALALVPTPAFRMMIIVMGFGVAISLLLAMTLVPVAFSFMKTPKPWRGGATSRVQGLLDRVLGFCARVSAKKAWVVIGVFAVGTAVATYGVNQLWIESAMTERLDDDNVVARDAEFFKQEFSGTNILQIFVSTPQHVDPKANNKISEHPGEEDELALEVDDESNDDSSATYTAENTIYAGIYDPDLFARVMEFEDAIKEIPGVESVQSIVTLMEQIHDQYVPDHSQTERFPRKANALAQYETAFLSGNGKALHRMINTARTEMLINVRLRSERMRAAARVGKDIEVQGNRILGDQGNVKVSGVLSLLGVWLDEIILQQARGLLLTFLGITIMMIIGLRSLRVGLLSMIPNFLPLFFLGGFAGLVYGEVDSDLLFIALLAISIGVDDTIHFLMRYRIEQGRSDSNEEALKRTFHYSGRAIIMTTSTLALGFAPFIWSNYSTFQLLGILLPLTLVFAMLADLLLVPAMAAVGLLKFPSKERRET